MNERSRRVIGLASIIYGVSILLSRLVGLIRESVIGRTLGNSGEADVYWTAFVLPDFLNYLLAGGVLSIVFIPMFQGHLARGDEDAGWRSFSVIGNFLGLLLVILTAILWVATPSLTPIIAPGMSPDQLELLNYLVRIILPAQIFHFLGALISSTLQARDAHTMPALAPIVYTSCIVIGGLVLAPTMGAEGFAWGVLAGSILGPFMLPLIGAMKLGLRWSPTLSPKHPDLRRYVVLSLPVMLGFSVVVLDDMVIKHFASELGDGVISRLQYARTLMKVPMGVFGMAIGMAAFPTLSRLFAGGERAEVWTTLTRSLRMTLVLAFIAQAGLTAAGPEVAEVIWGTSRFTGDQLLEIGQLTAMMCIGLWAWAAQMLVARGFYAQGNTWTPTIIGSVIMAASFPLYGWLADRYGAPGLAVASSTAIVCYVSCLLVFLRRSLGGANVPGSGVPVLIVRMVPATLVGIFIGWTISDAITDWPALIKGGLAGVGAVIGCGAAAMALKVAEVKDLRAKLTSLRA